MDYKQSLKESRMNQLSIPTLTTMARRAMALLFFVSYLIAPLPISAGRTVHAADCDGAYTKGMVYKELATATARYQLEALNGIWELLPEEEIKTTTSAYLHFYMGMDHLILGVCGAAETAHLKKAVSEFEKAMEWQGEKQATAVFDKKSAIRLKNLAIDTLQVDTANDRTRGLIDILDKGLSLPVKGNRLLSEFSTIRKQIVDRPLPMADDDFSRKLVEDCIEIKIPSLKESIKLYNPLNTICLSRLWFEAARRCYLQVKQKTVDALYFFPDTLYELGKYRESIEMIETLEKKEKDPLFVLRKAAAYAKLRETDPEDLHTGRYIGVTEKNRERKDLFYLPLEYALFLAEVKNSPRKAREYLMASAPDAMDSKEKDCAFFRGSRGFGGAVARLYYYRTLGRIYQVLGDADAAFRCLYYTYQQSEGINMKNIDPIFIARLIDTAFKQNKRPLLDEYLLRPPVGEKGDQVKSYVDLYPGCYPVMYYWGLLTGLQYGFQE